MPIISSLTSGNFSPTKGGLPVKNGSSQANAATSPEDLRNAGVTTNGVYWFTNGSTPYQAYALMDNTAFNTSTGGWVLAFNYNADSGNSALGGVPWYGNTTFWTGQNEQGQSSTTPWTGQVKTRAYDLYNFSSVMLVVHNKNGYTPNSSQCRGWGVYNNNNFSGNSIRSIMTNNTNAVVSSGGRVAGANYVGNLSWNSRRTDEARGGDLFIDTTVNNINNAQYNLVLNTTGTYMWGASGGTRITTTAAASATRGHVFAGLGIQHAYSGYGIQMSWAPVTAYCDGPAIYGTSATVNTQNINNGSTNFQSNSAIGNGCTNAWANGYINAGISVFVR
jgi:hypothetical protein